MTYSETLDYLFKQLPMYQRIGQAAYKADLTSTHALMKALDHPENGFKSVHVAGTNGKGSTSHLLASVLQEAGYRVGLYTSPHLVDFRERIRINGQMISEASVVEFVANFRDQFEPLNLSFFEWTVGLAFHYFRQQRVDIAIIEVGMGGRLDSTNVVQPELAVITNIGMDHAQFLGDTRAKIAVEKAGIMKSGIPVVIGKSQRETEGLFRKIALDNDSTIIFADQQFPEDIPACPLQGRYQSENFQTTLVALNQLQKLGWKISSSHLSAGFNNVLKNTNLRGRWELLGENPRVICDVGHNEEGISLIVEQLKTEEASKLHLVLGFVNDKAIDDLLKLFPGEASWYLTQADIPRAMTIERLSQAADALRIDHQAYSNVGEAYEAALENAEPNDLIFVGGSTFVVADLLKYIDTVK